MSENVVFSTRQRKFIEWLATPRAYKKPRTQEEFATEIGVSARTLLRWKKKDGLLDAVTARARELLVSDLPDIYGALRREATAGSYQHIKIALELAGEYVEQKDLNLKGNIHPQFVNVQPPGSENE